MSRYAVILPNSSTMENIKGIIFDYGGTIDSHGDHWSEVIWDGYQYAGVMGVDKAAFRDAYVHGERTLAKEYHITPSDNFRVLLLKKVRIQMRWLVDNGYVSDTDAERWSVTIADYCYQRAKACADEARSVLEALSAHYPMVLVSNFYGNVEAVLDDFDLRRFFKSIVESAVVGVRKPDPRIFELGVEALGLIPQDVLVVGDSFKKDILPALSIGCRVAWLKGKGWTADEDAVMHPSIISGLEELRALLTDVNE